MNYYDCPFNAQINFVRKWAVSYELVPLYHILMTYPMRYVIIYIQYKTNLKEFLKMAKIKKTDISKLSKLDQQIEELKKQKKKQEEELAKNIGDHIMNSIDIDELDSADDLYKIIDEVVEKFNQTEENIDKNIDDINSENETENIEDKEVSEQF